MLSRIFLVMIAMLSFAFSVEAGVIENLILSKPPAQQPPGIKVLIVHDQEGVVMEVKGKYDLIDPNTMSHISRRFIGKRKYIQAVQDGLRWGEAFPGLHQILIIPADPSITTVVDGIEYQGAIYVYNIGGTISIVNLVDIEDYLASRLSDYKEPFSEETLAAIAITFRTKAYYQSLNSKNPYWVVDARKVGYQGYAVGKFSSGIEKAIRATRYLVLSQTGAYDGGVTPFPAQWQSEGKGGIETVSAISLEQAEGMAKKGKDAAQILAKAFPGAVIHLTFAGISGVR